MRRSTGSVQTRRSSPTSGASTRSGSGERRRTTRYATAASTATTASPTISARRSSPPTTAPAPSASTMPRNSPAEPTAMPVGRDRAGRTAATPVMALSTNGCATATSSWPASAQPNPAPPSRTTPPSAVSTTPKASARRGSRSRAIPAGTASTT